MKRYIAAAAVAAALTLLTGCGGSNTDQAAAAEQPAATQAPKPTSDSDKKALLARAAQGYTDAVLSGDGAGATSYSHPTICDDADNGELILAAGFMKDTAKGATMRITEVYLNGAERGGVKSWELSDGAPDALRRLAEQGAKDSNPGGTWRWVDGEWYLAGPCEDDETPAPAGGAA